MNSRVGVMGALLVGNTVIYRFRGLNDSGIPRFASFMCMREDAAL